MSPSVIVLLDFLVLCSPHVEMFFSCMYPHKFTRVKGHACMHANTHMYISYFLIKRFVYNELHLEKPSVLWIKPGRYLKIHIIEFKLFLVYKSKPWCRDRLINTTIKFKSTLSLKWSTLYKVGAYEQQSDYKQYSRFLAN